MRLFKRKKPQVLKLEFSMPKTAKVSSHRTIKIGDKFYYRRDEVERIVTEVINSKIAKGELIPAPNGKKTAN